MRGWVVYGYPPNHKESQISRGVVRPSASSSKRGKPQKLSQVYQTKDAADKFAEMARNQGYTITGVSAE